MTRLLFPARLRRSVAPAGRAAEARPRHDSLASPPGEDPGPALADEAGQASVASLVSWIKNDLRERFRRGESPAVADYLPRFPVLRESHEPMLSLIYEEFCLRQERGESLDPESFCNRYEPWRDSLISQLDYHAVFSQAVSWVPRRVRLPEVGDQFLGFRLRNELGRGGTGRVFLADDLALGNRPVVVKITPDLGDEPALQGRLDHPHIVPVMQVQSEPATGLRGLCMPYYPGLSLDVVLKRLDIAATRPRSAAALWDVLGPPTTPAEAQIEGDGRAAWNGFPRGGTHAQAAAWVVLKLAEALGHAHARRVFHRDIKPANILLTRRGGPMLLDFNLAQSLASDAREAEAAATGGTLPYMAPEQLEAFLDPTRWAEVQGAADLFSLGLVLRELLTGERPPGPASSDVPPARAISQLLDHRRFQRWRPIRELNAAVPCALEAIVARCLAYRPEDRYSDASSLAEDLRRFLNHAPLRYASNPSVRERVENWALRHRWVGRIALRCIVASALTLAALKVAADLDGLHVLGNWNLNRGRPGVAKVLYSLNLWLAPGSYESVAGLAYLAERAEDLREGYRLMCEAIRKAEASAMRPEPESLADLYWNRARLAIRLGEGCSLQAYPELEARQGRHTPETRALTEQARRWHAHAVADLDRAEAILGLGCFQLESDAAFHAAFFRAKAETGLGDAASCFDEYEAAVRHFEQAAHHAQLAYALIARKDPEKSRHAKELVGAIRYRLEIDRPKRDLTAARSQAAD